ncbi:ADP-ribosylglycohydrolase family protein [Kocuria sp. UBA5001]|uniref:ADP-ribosylglycohydrolase family protein n=1 Tax=Kocuria sp. UBA5001 TaxID=1946674 RepID=UPI0025C5923C|nr:ADP-ribosylglycohydrolase family protein [Kocuria sp. UBA5001]
MTSPGTPELLDRDHGLDPSSSDYPNAVRSVLLAPWAARGPAAGNEAVQLSARSVGALNEVARWANDGQSADPTACAWLAYLRWAVANGAQLPSDAPRPPTDILDRDFPALSAAGPHEGDSFTALATGRLGEVVRPVLPDAQSPEVLARTAPYGLIPNVGWKSLIVLALDSAAITHGSPEAQTAATALVLTVHAAIRARSSDASLAEVLAETARVSSAITRAAPRTRDLLATLADADARAALWTGAPETLTGRLGTGDTATQALALGLAALLAVEDAASREFLASGDSARGGHAGSRVSGGRAWPSSGDDVARNACALLTDRGVTSCAARQVVVVVAAARWGLAAARVEAEDAPRAGDQQAAEPMTSDGTDSPGDAPILGAPTGSHRGSTENTGNTERAGITESAEDTESRDAVDPVRTELLRLAEHWTSLWRP